MDNGTETKIPEQVKPDEKTPVEETKAAVTDIKVEPIEDIKVEEAEIKKEEVKSEDVKSEPVSDELLEKIKTQVEVRINLSIAHKTTQFLLRFKYYDYKLWMIDLCYPKRCSDRSTKRTLNIVKIFRILNPIECFSIILQFYFGDVNLQRDKFLMEQRKLDEGWIPMTVMMTFKLLASMSTDTDVILQALKSSELIEVSEDGKKIRRSPDHPLPVFDEAYRKAQAERTVYVKGFPLTDIYIQKLKEFFKPYEPFENIIVSKKKSILLFFVFFFLRRTLEMISPCSHHQKFVDVVIIWINRVETFFSADEKIPGQREETEIQRLHLCTVQNTWGSKSLHGKRIR